MASPVEKGIQVIENVLFGSKENEYTDTLNGAAILADAVDNSDFRVLTARRLRLYLCLGVAYLRGTLNGFDGSYGAAGKHQAKSLARFSHGWSQCHVQLPVFLPHDSCQLLVRYYLRGLQHRCYSCLFHVRANERSVGSACWDVCRCGHHCYWNNHSSDHQYAQEIPRWTFHARFRSQLLQCLSSNVYL